MQNKQCLKKNTIIILSFIFLIITLSFVFFAFTNKTNKVFAEPEKEKTVISVDLVTYKRYDDENKLPTATTNYGDLLCEIKKDDVVVSKIDEVGEYDVKYSVNGNEDHTPAEINVKVVVDKAQVKVPTIKGTYYYTDKENSVEFNGVVDSLMEVDESSVLKATELGSYSVKFNLIDTDHYEWADGNDGEVTWVIQNISLKDPVIASEKKDAEKVDFLTIFIPIIPVLVFDVLFVVFFFIFRRRKSIID